jgi:FMN phosphatase YigB (HAD superfamily)
LDAKKLEVIRGLVFDMHGVLVFAFPTSKYREEVYRYFPEETFEALKKEFGTGSMVFWVNGMKKEYVQLLDALPVHCRKEQAIIKLLGKIHKRVPLYLATDTSRKSCVKSLRAAGYPLSLFDKILTIEDVDKPKPDLEIFRRLGVSRGFIVFGDQQTDVIPATKLGAKGIIVNSRKGLIRNLQQILRQLDSTTLKTRGRKQGHTVQNSII